jgi:hypothetical protein
MEFKSFQNNTNPLEYLQIFVFAHIEIKGTKEFEIDDYITFELTDTIIKSFNTWIENNEHIESNTLLWLKENPERVDYFISNFKLKFKPKVSIWSDRKKNAYYKGKLQDSFEFENYIANLIKEKYGLDLGQYLTPEGQYTLGENTLGIEIKNDTLISKYGNVYIECQEKSSGSNSTYVNSGILKADNCRYFLIGTVEKFYIFRKETLIQILKEEIDNLRKGIQSKRNITFKRIATSKGYVYPVRYAVKDTITMDTMINEIRERLNI